MNKKFIYLIVSVMILLLIFSFVSNIVLAQESKKCKTGCVCPGPCEEGGCKWGEWGPKCCPKSYCAGVSTTTVTRVRTTVTRVSTTVTGGTTTVTGLTPPVTGVTTTTYPPRCCCASADACTAQLDYEAGKGGKGGACWILLNAPDCTFAAFECTAKCSERPQYGPLPSWAGIFINLIKGNMVWGGAIPLVIAAALGIPPQWLTLPTFIYMVIIPFLGLWMIVYGFMKELGIFRKAERVNIWLPFLIALATLPTHLFFPLVNALFNLIGAWAVIMFGVVFGVGTWYYTVLRKAEYGSAASLAEAHVAARKSIRDQLKALYAERAALVKEIPEAEGERLDKITARIQKIDDEISRVRGSLKELEEVE